MPLIASLLCAQQAGLRIEVLEGQGAINNVHRRTAWEPVVRVTDSAGAPIAGAVVTFVLPGVGASGVFGDGSKVLSVQTDESGRAIGRGLRPNSVAGPFEIRVTATHAGASTSAAVSQTNAAPAESAPPKSRKVLLVTLIAGGIAGGVAALTLGKGGSSSPAPAPTPGTITPGTPDIGPPR